MNKLLLSIVAIFLPPLAVLLDGHGAESVIISCLLTICCFWILGIVHALYCIWLKDEATTGIKP